MQKRSISSECPVVISLLRSLLFLPLAWSLQGAEWVASHTKCEVPADLTWQLGPLGRWLPPDDTTWSCAKLSGHVSLVHPRDSPKQPLETLCPPGSEDITGVLAGKRAILWSAHPTQQRPRGTIQRALQQFHSHSNRSGGRPLC